jgi:hydroxyacyl-ACP dehydratase HTD2-like protein with hotdog domain
VSDLSLAELGLSAEGTSVLPSEHIQMLAATLDVAFHPTLPLPMLWHWAFFNPVVSTAGLGPDGHPRRESPLLDKFPRRMWVGGEVQRKGPLQTDTPTRRRTRLVNHVQKHGSTGDLLIVTLEHTIEQHGNTALVEIQHLIFLEVNGATQAEGSPVSLPLSTGWREIFKPTAQLLFRFSAVTFNSHRIHYDHDYATRVEHYPGLVVHGPLTAMLLAGSASRHLDMHLRSFSYRASNPLFVDRPVNIDGEAFVGPNCQTATMTATRMDGAVGMTATATAGSSSFPSS